MRTRSKFGVVVLAAVLLTGFTVAPLPAQQKTLGRQFDPVVFDAINTPVLLGLTIDSLTAYRYSLSGDQWLPIPFQIDKVDSNGSFFGNETGPIDANDEVVFMPGDAGDRAPADKWLDDAGARRHPRIELALDDPLAPGGQAWVYLYRNVSNRPSVTGYLSYDRGSSNTAGTDTVFGLTYKVAHAGNGLPNFTAIKRSSGFTGNLIDRLKVRVNGSATVPIIGRLPYTIDEQTNLQFGSLNFASGPVRGYRLLADTLVIIVFNVPFLKLPFSFEMQYFPYSSSIIFKNATIDSADAETFGISHIRQSLDLNENSAGLTRQFFNAQNPGGITIDGVADSGINTAVVDERVNWLLASHRPASGDPFGLLVLVTVPKIGTTRNLYFKDNSTVDATDTGDQKSFGDFGVQVDGQKIQGRFSFDFSTYHLDAFGEAVATGEQFKNWQENPLVVTATAQTFPSAVAETGGAPASFSLHDAYPNPFAPQREPLRLAFSTGTNGKPARLTIYNLMGQEVMRFTALEQLPGKAGRREITWDGSDRFGRPLPAGVYFYRLQAGQQVAVKKFVLVR
ncbi:MAG: T9SS type A sorting domain-containing protein [candidate division KSB1 bacterium]|nr:T9SS type A sorting domain-containing protein [candidate division KSB1 bacterium]MDZ7275016.1 T9SS type A sorting domain-containing protein [candidate division KSB1 bacterium]MDZ7286535.1 T9SS type A sorting domain-containing protein [candidate division KSB1 bacterium]MDZ7299301.1 T9SS type A sorting domain-containing protein [candidate division KSB1 bacterium]MDZ7307359.1 T9SS type A sorting domain-containing protein [candidate division KSB1 bacterium]